MIGKLKGRVDSVFDDHIILDVNNVGYLVYCAGKTLHKLAENDNCQLFIETHLRQDHISLYGFLSIEEKVFFNLLQSVSGIGARIALAILSHLDPAAIAAAVSINDKNAFKNVTGVGAKLAEKIIIELRDKVTNLNIASKITSNSSGNHSLESDAVNVLINLGINRTEAYNKVISVSAKNPNISMDELIKLALKGSN